MKDALTLTVTAKTAVADGVACLDLTHPAARRLPDWTPGAHVDVTLSNGLTRQYSLCGDRWDPNTYRIAVLREPDGRGGSAYIHDTLRPGDPVAIGGPRNHFPLAPADRYRFIAGGIGITPLLPMIHQAHLLGIGWELLYGGRSRSSMAFLDELAGYGDPVRVRPQDRYGLLDLPGFLAHPVAGEKVYCCGPAPLLLAVEAACADRPPYTLRTERFVARDPGAPVRTTPFQVALARTGTTVTVPPDRSVLDAVRSAGVDVLSSCRQGTCGTCETTVLDGAPDHRDSLLDDDERAAGDCMYICVSRARSDRLILDL